MKLTSQMLKKIIEEEASKFGKMTDTEDAANDAAETDADEFANSLEKHVDFMKALKIEETRLVNRLARIREARIRTAKKIAKI